MKLRALLAMLALLWSTAAAAQGIERLVEVVSLDAEGNGRVAATLSLSPGPATGVTVRAPVGRPVASSVRGTAPSVAVEAAASDGAIVIRVGERSQVLVVELTYDVEQAIDFSRPPLAHGTRRVRYEFVNVSGLTVAEFEGTLVLPAGLEPVSTSEVLPDDSAGAVPATLELNERDRRRVVVLRGSDLRMASAVGVTVAVGVRRSPVPMYALVATLCCAYLYAFRDLAAGGAKASQG